MIGVVTVSRPRSSSPGTATSTGRRAWPWPREAWPEERRACASRAQGQPLAAARGDVHGGRVRGATLGLLTRRRLSVPFVYILRCGDGSLYTGIAKDLEQRLERHRLGKASKYTRSRLPVVLVWKRRRDDLEPRPQGRAPHQGPHARPEGGAAGRAPPARGARADERAAPPELRRTSARRSAAVRCSRGCRSASSKATAWGSSGPTARASRRSSRSWPAWRRRTRARARCAARSASATSPRIPSFAAEETVESVIAAAHADDAHQAAGLDGDDPGPRRLRRPRAGGADALRRMEEAPGHRARAGPRAGHPAHGRADEPPRRGRHPLAGGDAADAGRAPTRW